MPGLGRNQERASPGTTGVKAKVGADVGDVC